MQLPLALGVGDIRGGRSTEQGKPLWKKHPSHQRSGTTEQHEGCWVLSAPCSRFSTGFLWFPAKALPGSSVRELNAHNLLVGFYYVMDWCRQKNLDLLTQLKCCTEFLENKVVLHNLLLPKQVTQILMFLTRKCLLVNRVLIKSLLWDKCCCLEHLCEKGTWWGT